MVHSDLALSDLEITRYARHLILPEVGGAGQLRLKAAKVCVVGAGGLGAPLLLYLAAAGVGTLGIIDCDHVSLSNLQRQILYRTADLGAHKVNSAATHLHGLNPHITLYSHAVKLEAGNALDLFSGYDIIVDGSDNFATRFLVSDACYFAQKPLVSAAVGQFDGQISTFKPYMNSPHGTPYPTYRCLTGGGPQSDKMPACDQGILGALPGLLGSLQALEVLKEILSIGQSLTGRLLLVDALSTRFYEVLLDWNPQNPLNGLHPSIHDLNPLNYT